MTPDEIRAYYQSHTGQIAPSIDAAITNMPGAMAGYMQQRQFITDPAGGEGLPAKYVGLVFATLDVLAGNYDGALTHSRAGLRAGLTWHELMQGMVQTWVVGGFASTWGMVGWRVVDQLQREGFGPQKADAKSDK